MLDTKKMIGISVADYIMEIWDYIILVNRSDYALYEHASDNDVLCDLLIWILGKSFAELEKENAEEILWMELISTAVFCIVQIVNKSFTLSEVKH